MKGAYKQAKRETPVDDWTATRRTYPTTVTQAVGKMSQSRMSFLSLSLAQTR